MSIINCRSLFWALLVLVAANQQFAQARHVTRRNAPATEAAIATSNAVPTSLSEVVAANGQSIDPKWLKRIVRGEITRLRQVVQDWERTRTQRSTTAVSKAEMQEKISEVSKPLKALLRNHHSKRSGPTNSSRPHETKPKTRTFVTHCHFKLCPMSGKRSV